MTETLEVVAKAEAKPAGKGAEQIKPYKESEDPDLSYFACFNHDLNRLYEAY